MAEATQAPGADSTLGELDTPDGARVVWRRWTPAGPPRAAIVLLHGVGEHGGRYADVAAQLNAVGIVVTALDFRGFGRSSGRRGDLRLACALDDIELVVAQESAAHGVPVFLYGHSLGGLVAFLYGVDRRPDLAGMILTGPAIDSELRRQRLKVAVAKALARVRPGLTMPSGLVVENLNRDPKIVAAYVADPLVHDRASVGFAADSVAAMDRVVADAHTFDLPLFIGHGGADAINPISGSRAIAERVAGRHVLRIYDGAYHSLEHEPQREQLIADVIAWMAEVLETG